MLIYVPEGSESATEKEDSKSINEYSKIISVEYSLTQHQFIGTTKNRSDILERFASGKLSVLTAMKCLDEGIDVRRTEIAIFVASSGNSRQFIQRRGRILRKHPDKKYAFIYDMVVIPNLNTHNFNDQTAIARKIIKDELKRVEEFANTAVNKYQALECIEKVIRDFDIDIYNSY